MWKQYAERAERSMSSYCGDRLGGARRGTGAAQLVLRAAAIGSGAPGDGDARLTQPQADLRRKELHVRGACACADDLLGPLRRSSPALRRAPRSVSACQSSETQAVGQRGCNESGRQNLQVRRLVRAPAVTRPSAV